MNPLRKARANGEEGLSLIELMIAVFILAVAILALAGVATQSVARVRVARDQQSAADLVSAQLEAARGVDFDTLALDSADPSIPATYDGAPIVKDAGAPLAHRETVSHGNRSYAITRYVTAPTPAPDQDPVKRVTVVVSWSDGETDRELVNTTIVAAADRGLPVPQFDLEPPNSVVAFEAGTGYHVNAYDISTAECFTHTLTNLGLTDRYAWRLDNRQDSNAVSATAGGDRFTDVSRKWTAKAWLQPATGSLVLDSTTLMRDSTPESGRIWMEAATPVGSKESAWLTVCYWSTDSTAQAQLGNQQQYFVKVRSQFDPSVVATSVQTVTVGDDTLRFYLHELDKNHTGNWSTSGHVRKVQGKDYPPMFMDTNAATDDLVHDMDTARDGTATPGLRLRHDAPASAAVWDYTVPAARPLVSASFTIFVAAPGDPETQAATLTYELQRVSADGATVLQSYAQGAIPLNVSGTTGSGASFVAVSPPTPLTFASGTSIDAGAVLRLIIGCADDSEASTDCHVDFDTTSRQGFLEVSR